MSEKDHVLQKAIEVVIEQAGIDDWIAVYRHRKTLSLRESLSCALVPNGYVEKALADVDWDMQPNVGPGCVQYGGAKTTTKYLRFVTESGLEPLVIERSFHGLKPESLEILEEFRLFHNLYFDQLRNTFVKIDSDGNETDVIQMREDEVKIRLKELRQFLALKDAHLALFFDHRYTSSQTINDMGLLPEYCDKTVRKDLTHYDLVVRDLSSGEGSFSRLLGKKLIPGTPKNQSGVWPYDKEKKGPKREQFIVGTDKDGNEIWASSESPGTGYLTPVFFKKEVLAKYYDAPSKYSVEDGYLRCGGLWGVEIDNDDPEYVMVYLGDLGRDLPTSEHPYWRHFNIAHSGPQSATSFQRDVLAQFTDPQSADLVFKSGFHEFQKTAEKKLGWSPFKPLRPEDAHCLAALRIPLNEEQAEFDLQVQYLTKILIDSLNEEEIGKRISALPPESKGIKKLEAFLKEKHLPDPTNHIDFLKDLQDLRSSSAAHRKGSNYQKTMKRLGFAAKTKKQAFTTLLEKSANLLTYFGNELLK